jgi:predicted AAA+ superfamily ATPase
MPTQSVLNYLEFLQSAYLLYKVKRSDAEGKKIFEIGEKYYFEDWGIRNAITGYKQKDISKILENVVFIHLKTLGFKVFVGKLGNKEIDFICERNGERVYIQVAYLIPDEKVKEREFGNLLIVNDNWRKIVVSLDPFPAGLYKGIEHIHLRKFLTEFN